MGQYVLLSPTQLSMYLVDSLIRLSGMFHEAFMQGRVGTLVGLHQAVRRHACRMSSSLLNIEATPFCVQASRVLSNGASSSACSPPENIAPL